MPEVRRDLWKNACWLIRHERTCTGGVRRIYPVVKGTVGAPATSATSGIEADVVDTVPKTMQVKARRLMDHLKRDIAWTARGELIHEGVPIVGSNVVDPVNDMLH